MKVGNTEAQILMILAESTRGLHAYTVYKRLKLPLADVIKAILKLQGDNLLSLSENEHVSLTTDGHALAYKIASKVSLKAAKPWNEVPKKFKKTHGIKDLDFYIPRKSLLNKNFFC